MNYDINLDGDKFSVMEILEALNYGTSPLFPKLASVWNHRQDIRKLSHFWDRSLIMDFANRLLNDNKDVYKAIYGVNLGLKGKFEDYMATENTRLVFGVLGSFNGVLSRHDFRPPNSFIVFDLIRIITYLKEHIATSKSAESSLEGCVREIENFWQSNNSLKA